MKWWYVGLGAFICGVMLLVTQMSGRYSSFPDAIRADLRTQGIAVRTVEELHTWPDTVNNITYGANIRVVLVSGSMYWGRLECRAWQKQCAYRLAALQPMWRSLADLVAPPVWWEWLHAWYDRVF